jgi:UrcA family protein
MSDRLKSAGLAALSFSLSAGLLAAALTPATANASQIDTQSGYERITVTVKADDLDLTSKVDQRRLDRRIRNAAREMCDTGAADRVGQSGRLCRLDAVRSTATEVASLLDRSERLAQANQPDRLASSLAITDVQVR